jgi:hypothetical protein
MSVETSWNMPFLIKISLFPFPLISMHETQHLVGLLGFVDSKDLKTLLQGT